MQYKGLFWRALALVLGFWAVPVHAGPAEDQARKQAQVMFDYFLERLVEFGWGKLALITLGYLVAGFFLSVLVARLLAGKAGTALNTLRYYIISFLLTVLLFAVAGGIAAFCVSTGSSGGALIVGFFGLIGLLIIGFAVPMTIYDIGFFRALALNILISVGLVGLQIGAEPFVTGPFDALAGKSEAEVKQIIGEWDMNRRQKEMEERMNQLAGITPTETVAAQAQRLYAELQQAREQLDVNDQAAVAKFNDRVAEYNSVKAKLIPASAPAGAGR